MSYICISTVTITVYFLQSSMQQVTGSSEAAKEGLQQSAVHMSQGSSEVSASTAASAMQGIDGSENYARSNMAASSDQVSTEQTVTTFSFTNKLRQLSAENANNHLLPFHGPIYMVNFVFFVLDRILLFPSKWKLHLTPAKKT